MHYETIIKLEGKEKMLYAYLLSNDDFLELLQTAKEKNKSLYYYLMDLTKR